ncbi:MAG: molybdopterin-dependent oxidoreductase [Acidobacteriota bacterium]|nr:molybdopterin-dependent oxidoreductase [Acidobacteriota bacterium]
MRLEKGGHVATCAEIAIAKEPRDKNKARVRIVRVVEAFECGAVVNPLHLKNQMEGAIVQAVGGLLFEAKGRRYGFSIRIFRWSDISAIARCAS